MASTYSDFYSTPADLADSAVIFGRVRHQQKKLAPGILIDLGCGPGTALEWNVAWPDQYVGIDPSEGMITEARKRWPKHTFVHGDHHAIQPRSAIYILGAFGPLQYIHPHQRPDAARRIIDGLVPGGRFLMMARPRGKTAIFDTAHVDYPASTSELLRIFHSAGASDVIVSGHRRYVPRTFKGQEVLLRFERLFPLRPDRAEWLVIEGKKPGGWYRKRR